MITISHRLRAALLFTGAALAVAMPLTAAHAGGPADDHLAAAPAGGLPTADKPDPDDIAAAGRNSLTIGGGAAYLPSYDGSNDYVVVPVAAVRGSVDGFNFSTRGTQLSLDLIRERPGARWNFQLGPVVGGNFNRTGRIVDPQVRALGKKAFALEVGGFVGISRTGLITSAYDTLSIRVSVTRDVTGVHDSYIITPSIDYGTPLDKRTYIGISGSATFVGDKYARSYFAVDTAGSARSGLPVFANPRGGMKNYTITGLLARSLTGDLRHGLALYAAGSYSRLQGDFAASPLVSIAGDRNQWLGAIGLGYTF